MSTPTAVKSESQRGVSRGEQLVQYIAGTSQRRYPPEVIDAALRALVDHLGCAVGASNDAPVRPARGGFASCGCGFT